MAETGINIIATLAFLGNIALLTMLILYVAKKAFGLGSWDKLASFLRPKSYYLVFFLSFIATLASLFLSEVVKFTPCILCWYQRIFMYPQPILLYLAVVRNERILAPYLMVMNAIGSCIALYHYSLHVFPNILPAGCDPSIVGVSCIKGYSFYYGFMTFPYMAFVVFALNLVLLSISLKRKR